MNSWRVSHVTRYHFLFSLFLIYHTAAICLAPAPDSYLKRNLFPLFQPYLKILRLNNYWGYFAPDPASGILMRYRIEAKDGSIHVFKLTEALKRRDPNFLRLTSLFNKMPDANPAYLQSAADYLCGRHETLRPDKIQFIEGHQMRFSPWAWNSGTRPFDDNYMKLKLHDWLPCKEKAGAA